ncbi:MAG: cytochrome b [Hyphomicrobiales bacterium]|nr:cytochrome b [Hyphomicrobiales bacterium]
MAEATFERYHPVAVWLHWIIAILILANLALGVGAPHAADAWQRPLIDLHKSIGISLLFLVLARIIWRLGHRPPPLPDHYAGWERFAARGAHGLLYALILLVPVTGWMHDSAWSAGPSHPIWLFGLIPWFRLGFIANLDPATKHNMHLLLGSIHYNLAFGLAALVGLHVVAALKHQFIDRHPELQRMWH